MGMRRTHSPRRRDLALLVGRPGSQGRAGAAKERAGEERACMEGVGACIFVW